MPTAKRWSLLRSLKGNESMSTEIAEAADNSAVVDFVEEVAISWMNALHTRARISRWLFRLSGVSVLLLGASLPILSAMDGELNKVTVTIIGASIGLISSFSAFYRWSDRWRIYRRAELDIEAALRSWELAVLNLAGEESSGHRQRDLLTATGLLADRVRETVEQQHLAFFESLQLGLPAIDTSRVGGAGRDSRAVSG